MANIEKRLIEMLSAMENEHRKTSGGPQYHSPRTFVSFEFRCGHSMQ